MALEDRKTFADTYIQKIETYYNSIISKKNTNGIFVFNLVEEDDTIFGNYANKVTNSFLYQVRKINMLLMDLAIANSNLHIIDIKKIHQRLGDEKTFSTNSYISTDIIFSLESTPIIAKNICDVTIGLLGKFKKCLLLDLDNTIWGGIIGDDGIENIQVGGLGIGKAFTNFQKWIKELKNRGVILCVCSKNYESVAKVPFKKHPDMILKLEDISVFVANWNNKADNIRYIQSVLNIGFDSMVFIDDNKFESILVKQNIPKIEVPDLPEDLAEYINYLKNLNLFETVSHSQNDINRTTQYQEESKRKKQEISFGNQSDFLKSLNMQAKIEEFNTFNLPRIAQLIQRSNQFNLRTIRYTEDELLKLSNSKKHMCFTVSLKDKYGNYGLVSILVLEIKKASLFIDTWVMSCRVLKRDVENLILNYIMETTAKIAVANSITAEYIPTKKNALVKDLYLDLGFTKKSDIWELKSSDFTKKPHFINI